MGKKVVVLIGLLILGGITAIVVWLLVFLPFRVMQPVEFIPLAMPDGAAEELEQKLDRFVSGADGTIELSREDLGLLIMRGVEGELGLDVAALAVELGKSNITTIINVEIGDIPSSGYLTWILTRRDVEYTTTLISADVWTENGNVAYDLLDFRIGKFKIPNVITRRLLGEQIRSIEGVYIQEMELHDDYIRVTRRM
jgi:hypothetical protein